jgi:phage terminase large subunit-like protein
MREMEELARLLVEKGEPALTARVVRQLTAQDLLVLDAHFETWAHEAQRPPSGDGWRTWLLMAGRHFGKTRAGAEWVTRLALQPRRPVRIALVGATEADVRSVMIEGESGLLSVAPRGRRPVWEPSLRRLRWPGGSIAQVYSAEAPEALRGPAHHYAWCDELAKWARAEETWDNLQMTLRCGDRPRALVTTTPRPIPLMKRILAEEWTAVTRGRTRDNAAHNEAFTDLMVRTYGGTRVGRQELDGELIEDIEGSLWPRSLIEQARAAGVAPGGDFPRVVIGVDPPASAGGDACGIVVCGLGNDGKGYVLEDASVEGMRPEGWARAVAAAAERWEADRVIAEANNGGAMVESVLKAAEASLPVRLVHASKGKTARAEPVAYLFETGKARFAGAFPALEDELAGLTIGSGYEGPGRSPDRADAMVWAMHALMLGKKQARPGVRML